MDADLLSRFLDLKQQQSRIEKELDELRQQVCDEVKRAGGKIDFRGTRMLSRTLRSWSFSDEVRLLEKILRDKRREEISSGRAKLVKETQYVLVRAPSRKTTVTVGAAKKGRTPERVKAYDVATIRRKYPRAYEAWSDEEDLALEKQFQQGRTISELSHVFHRQPGGIRSRLAKLRLL